MIQHIGKGISPPKREGDVGYDLSAAEHAICFAGRMLMVPIDLRMKLPDRLWGLVVGRSSTHSKKGLIVIQGVIDNGYTGQLFACVFNASEEMQTIKKGEAFAQLLIMPMITPELVEVEALPATERGGKGFGSTG